MSRGNARQSIFLDDQDRRAFLGTLGWVAERRCWRVFAYALMPNHYHLVIQTAEANLAQGMHDLNGRYAGWFNNRHERVGHLFQGRYRAPLVDDDGHLRQVIRYVALNPVRARLCDRPESWPWGSHRFLTSPRLGAPRWLDVDSALRAFGDDVVTARHACRRLVEDDDAPGDSAAAIGEPVPLDAWASEAYLREATARIAPAGVPAEIPRRDRPRPDLDALCLTSKTRNEAIRAAHVTGAFTLREIGKHFGLHYSSVSRIVRSQADMLQFKI
jgi:REP element-mobilizing transposase RayT